MGKRRIVLACIEHNGQILLTQLSNGSLSGKWEFPGGEVEEKETDKEAIVREIYKKMNISVKCDYKMCQKEYKDTELVLYHCSYISGEVVLHNLANHIYVDKKILHSYDFNPIEIPFVNYVMKEQI